jgi:tetratricopeptide (TPR) repeat protein
MKIILLIVLFLNAFSYDNFGFSWDDREINKKGDFIFEYKDYNNYAYFKTESRKLLFDIYKEDGGLQIVKTLYFDKNDNLLSILIGANNTLKGSPDNKCDSIYAVLYNATYYKVYKNFFLKIILKNQDLNGHDGDVLCKKNIYPYKTENELKKKYKQMNITDNIILNSLEEFIKPDYAKKYDSLFTFKDSSFDIDTLESIINEIPITTKTLTQYNDIAYYLQQAKANDEAIFLLEKIIEKFPNRTVAYLNLADAYDGINDKEKAKENYEKYINLMKQDKKENKIPQRVLEYK